MFKKKMLTEACALGILACGACFLPPLPAPRPTAPPMPVAPRWRHVYGVRVVAADVSDSHHLDGEDLAMKVANRINWMARDTGIRAFASRQAGSEQAVLELRVEKESATQSAASAAQKLDTWSFSIGISAMLTDRSGQVLWQDVEPAVLFQATFFRDPSIEIWNHAGIDDSLPQFLSNRVASRALYQR